MHLPWKFCVRTGEAVTKTAGLGLSVHYLRPTLRDLQSFKDQRWRNLLKKSREINISTRNFRRTPFGNVLAAVYHWPVDMDAVLRFHAEFMMKQLKEIVTDEQLFNILENALKCGRCKIMLWMESGLPCMFPFFSLVFASVFGSIAPTLFRPPHIDVEDVVENTGRDVTFVTPLSDDSTFFQQDTTDLLNGPAEERVFK